MRAAEPPGQAFATSRRSAGEGGAYLGHDGRHGAGLFKAPPKKAVLSRTQFGKRRMEDRDGQVPTGEEAVSRWKVVAVS